jgi:hypothetical protein
MTPLDGQEREALTGPMSDAAFAEAYRQRLIRKPISASDERTLASQVDAVVEAALAAREEPQRRFSEREVEAIIEAAHDHGRSVERAVDDGEIDSDDEEALPLTIESAVKLAEELSGRELLGKPIAGARARALAAREDTERPREFVLTLSHGAIYAEWGPVAVVEYRDGEQIRVVEVPNTERPDERREAWEESVARRIDAKQARGER